MYIYLCLYIYIYIYTYTYINIYTFIDGIFGQLDWEPANLLFLESACSLYHTLIEDRNGEILYVYVYEYTLTYM
jgi:hypothetical protein